MAKEARFYSNRIRADLGVAKTTVYRWEKNMRIIPPFLHLALEYIEMKRDEFRDRAMKMKKEMGAQDKDGF